MTSIRMRRLVISLLFITLNTLATCYGDVNLSGEAQVSARFYPNDIRLIMDNTTQVNYTIAVDKKALTSGGKSLQVDFHLVTLSPQLDIVEFDSKSSSNSQNITLNSMHSVNIDLGQLHREAYIYNSSFYLKATYIGHAAIKLQSKLITLDGTRDSLNTAIATSDQITIIRNEGVLDKIFMYSVIVFITISYINLGAQIDMDNASRLITTPKIIFFGFIVGIVVMPASSWVIGHFLFHDQPMYRIGSFIYACAPAASASVLWTVMFDADKELALGLQISSTVGALITMPIYLYAMDKSIDLEGQYTIKVPYLNLARTLVVLLIALLIGSRLVNRNKRARQISQKVFRPLTMFVLLFIIIFSSVVYWYVYRMFNLHITLMAFLVTSATFIFSGLLGYLIKRDIDQMITISISSTYRNSGIAFAALVVAFQPPDIFIAYVPCLTQVVTTSLIGLVFYAVKSLKKK